MPFLKESSDEIDAYLRWLPPLCIGAQAFLFTAPAHAADKVCKLEIAGNDLMQFDKKELTVAKDCTSVEVTLKHTGKLPAAAMGHNWSAREDRGRRRRVERRVCRRASRRTTSRPAMRASLRTRRSIGGGQSATVTFPTSKLKAGESYSYLCTFPGHSALMKGTLKFG